MSKLIIQLTLIALTLNTIVADDVNGCTKDKCGQCAFAGDGTSKTCKGCAFGVTTPFSTEKPDIMKCAGKPKTSNCAQAKTVDGKEVCESCKWGYASKTEGDKVTLPIR